VPFSERKTSSGRVERADCAAMAPSLRANIRPQQGGPAIGPRDYFAAVTAMRQRFSRRHVGNEKKWSGHRGITLAGDARSKVEVKPFFTSCGRQR